MSKSELNKKVSSEKNTVHLLLKKVLIGLTVTFVIIVILTNIPRHLKVKKSK